MTKKAFESPYTLCILGRKTAMMPISGKSVLT
jgi:hypothetical protein